MIYTVNAGTVNESTINEGHCKWRFNTLSTLICIVIFRWHSVGTIGTRRATQLTLLCTLRRSCRSGAVLTAILSR